MTKLNIKEVILKKYFLLGLYSQNFLDILLTHILVIAFLYKGHPFIASILISVDAFNKMILSVPLSRLASQTNPHLRGQLCMFLRIVLIVFWTIIVFNLSQGKEIILTLFILFKILIAIDFSMSSEFIFLLKQHYHIELNQSSAAQNLIVRGSTALAPAMALLLLSKPNIAIVILILLLTLTGLSITYFSHLYFITLSNRTIFHAHNEHASFKKLCQNPLMRWGFKYQLLGNLSFSGVAFLLLGFLQPSTSFVFNEITLLYTGFMIGQAYALILGDNIIPIKTILGTSTILGLCALLVLITGILDPGTYRLIICLILGLTHSISTTGIQTVLTEKIQGTSYIEFMGWAQTLGRFTSFATTTIIGFALSKGYSIQLLLIICGIVGILSSIALKKCKS